MMAKLMGGRLIGIVLGGLMSLVIAGTVIAQTVFGIDVPIIGRLLGSRGSSGSGKSSFKRFGINGKKTNPDKVIAKLAKRARKWRRDAKLYSITILNMKTDGTCDFLKGGSIMTIEFFSPALVGSSSVTKRKKSIKKYLFNSVGFREEMWGVKKAYPNVPGTPIPKCSAKQIGKIMKSKGVTGTFQATLDPGFAFATKGLSYNVQTSKGKRVHVYLDIHNCAVLKEL